MGGSKPNSIAVGGVAAWHRAGGVALGRIATGDVSLVWVVSVGSAARCVSTDDSTVGGVAADSVAADGEAADGSVAAGSARNRRMCG